MSSADDSELVDKWTYRQVFIRKGRYVGNLGSVVGFANGRFRVQIGDVVINKQMSQLELYDPAQHTTAVSEPGSTNLRPLRSAIKTTPSLIGSRVRILNGKFGGYCGLVSKGGNGYFAVEIDNGVGNTTSIVMKRSSELVILSKSTTPGEIMTMASSEDVQKAAIILLDLMQSEMGTNKEGCRALDSFETIEGY